MKRALVLAALIAYTTLAAAVMACTSPYFSGTRAATLAGLARQEWQEGRRLGAAQHCLFALVVSASDAVLHGRLSLVLARVQLLVERDKLEAALDVCQRAVRIANRAVTTAPACRHIEARLRDLPTPSPPD